MSDLRMTSAFAPPSPIEGLNLDPLPPSAVREILARLGLTQLEASELLGVTTRTLRCWLQPPHAATHRSCSRSARMLLVLLIKRPEMVDVVRKIADDSQDSQDSQEQ